MNTPSYRAWFLIIVACAFFHLPFWGGAVILVGFGIAEYFDQRRVRNVRDKIFEYEVFDWEPCEDDKEQEEKGAISRVRLVGGDQILFVRIAEMLSKMP